MNDMPTPYPDPESCDIGHMLLSNDPMRVTRTMLGWTMWHKLDTGIGRAFRLTGEYAVYELQNILKLISAGDTVIDVGAFIGTHTLAFARRVAPTGRVFAHEPNRSSYQMLCANLIMNGITGVHTIPAAAGARDCAFLLPTFYDDREFDRGMFNVRSVPRNAPGQEQVGIVPIDALNLPQCRLIKISTPGMTADVLQGTQETVKRAAPIFYISIFQEEEVALIRQHLTPLGYDLYHHNTPLFRPDNVAKLREDPFGGAHKRTIIATPKELGLQFGNLPKV